VLYKGVILWCEDLDTVLSILHTTHLYNITCYESVTRVLNKGRILNTTHLIETLILISLTITYSHTQLAAINTKKRIIRTGEAQERDIHKASSRAV
jgi:hypothetical protein